MTVSDNTPVIVGVGEYVDRPADPAAALEPAALIAEALKAANADSGGAMLQRIDSIDLIALISWRYEDPVKLVCQMAGISPARQTNSTFGGESPVRLIHDAALRIQRGEQKTAAIVGGEALHARLRARKEKVALPWTPLASREDEVKFPGANFEMSKIARALRISDPAHIYPLYEVATQAAWGQTPAEAQKESAALWAQYAQVAATNPSAWIRHAPDAEEIGTPSAGNRLISWPYPKLMVANPNVNQAASIIVTSVGEARAAGVPDEKMVFLWGGAAAVEPEDYLKRDSYAHSTAQAAVLEKAKEIVGGDAHRFDRMELYSCFPVVPKMALRTLGLEGSGKSPTVAGGLTFFGGPLNNYMSHAVCAMVREMRTAPGSLGLVYGQGGYVNKHHAIIVSTTPADRPLSEHYSVQAEAEAARGPVPPLLDDYEGPATIETYTVRYDRDGAPIEGAVIARTPEGGRVMARVMADDEASIGLLQSTECSAVGISGHVRIDVFGKPTFEAGEKRDRRAMPRRFSKLEREGPTTIVTIDRPDQMNALNPAANAELAEAFDDFAADASQWVAILTGAGDRAFSAGNDLKYTAWAMAKGHSFASPRTGFAGLTGRFDLDKPVIAAVNGLAMGGGFEIALACDIIIASEDAVFALPEPKVGLAALESGLLRLPREIGLKRAMDMILTGRRLTAREGLELGFVNRVVPAGEVMDAARAYAQEILACSPMSIRASKQIVRRGMEEDSLEAAYRGQLRYPATRALFRSTDSREGPLAFAQKRPPQWKGE